MADERTRLIGDVSVSTRIANSRIARAIVIAPSIVIWLLYAVAGPLPGLVVPAFVTAIVLLTLWRAYRGIRDAITGDSLGWLLALTFIHAWSTFLALFAYGYWQLSHADARAFSEGLSKLDALYFTVTTFTTTGFGDVEAVSPPARALVTAQMAIGFLLVSIAFSLAVSRGWRSGRSGGSAKAEP